MASLPVSDPGCSEPDWCDPGTCHSPLTPGVWSPGDILATNITCTQMEQLDNVAPPGLRHQQPEQRKFSHRRSGPAQNTTRSAAIADLRSGHIILGDTPVQLQYRRSLRQVEPRRPPGRQACRGLRATSKHQPGRRMVHRGCSRSRRDQLRRSARQGDIQSGSNPGHQSASSRAAAGGNLAAGERRTRRSG